ncbi:MAG: Flp pilus assembly protein CpaB [Rhodospirillales bacterium]|nr:Flp pilus assembly protein CpaB [Rhodospirillales bacterium]
MTLKNIILLLIALGTAGMTAMLANNWISSERAAFLASAPKQVIETSTVQVLVVNTELKAGSFVRKENLKWQPWPEEGSTDVYALKGQRDIKDFIGAVVRTSIMPGQPITDRQVVHPGDRGFLAAVLQPGSRAVSVPVNATSGISGFIFPGDKVDLILTSQFNSKNSEGDNRSRHVSKTILSGIRVLAIDQKTESKDGEVSPAKTVTMEVTPRQAEKVAIGMVMGSLSLSLQSLARDETGMDGSTAKKPTRDTGRGFTLDTDVNALVAGLTKRPGRGMTVNVLRGSEVEQAAF